MSEPYHEIKSGNWKYCLLCLMLFHTYYAGIIRTSLAGTIKDYSVWTTSALGLVAIIVINLCSLKKGEAHTNNE